MSDIKPRVIDLIFRLIYLRFSEFHQHLIAVKIFTIHLLYGDLSILMGDKLDKGEVLLLLYVYYLPELLEMLLNLFFRYIIGKTFYVYLGLGWIVPRGMIPLFVVILSHFGELSLNILRFKKFNCACWVVFVMVLHKCIIVSEYEVCKDTVVLTNLFKFFLTITFWVFNINT